MQPSEPPAGRVDHAAVMPPGGAGQRRLRGAFYTPSGLADALVGWAVQRTTQQVFDPCFGGGVLLASAVERFGALRRRDPPTRVFGVEVDAAAAAAGRAHLATLGVPGEHLLTHDVFAVRPTDYEPPHFDAIVGNPPYVRHHLLDADRKNRARASALAAGLELSERADMWAYVFGHLLPFLGPAGRMGLILPSSILHADYALPVLETLAEPGRRSRLIRVHEHQFPEVAERTVVLLVENGDGAGELIYEEVADLDGLRRHLRRRGRWAAGGPVEKGERSYSSESRRKTRMRWFLPAPAASLWSELSARPEIVPLKAVAKVRIGVVTGANRFFVRRETEIEELVGTGVTTVPIVSRGGWPNGVRWTAEHDEKRAASPSRLLLIEADAQPGAHLAAAIAEAEREEAHTRSHCRKREPWYSVADHAAPDLFLPYMSAEWPRLVINLSGATCTNSVHRVNLLPGAPSAAELAVASWTSVARLSAELIGRSYGAGVLKLEISEANELRLPLFPHAAESLLAIEDALMSSGRGAARYEADRLILRDGLGLTTGEVERISNAADALHRRRSR